MEEPLVNRVQESGLIQLDLSRELLPRQVDVVDVSQWLDQGFVLREKDFRDSVKSWDASSHAGHLVALHCTTDAILPDWAWMLVAQTLNASGAQAMVGSKADATQRAWHDAVLDLDLETYRGQRVIVKGCASAGGPNTLVTFTQHLGPVVKSLMFGEACSAVPIVKNRPA